MSATATRRSTPSGDGAAGLAPVPLALPGAAALGLDRPRGTARPYLLGAAALALAAAAFAVAVPVERTVELSAVLAPAHTVRVRPLAGGLVDEVLVAPGDTVYPGRLLARVFDPGRAARHPRRASLAFSHLHVPDSLISGAVVLTEDLDRLAGANVEAGSLLLELGALDAHGRLPLVARGAAPEREAHRLRPGLPARLTVEALPQERPRRLTGRVTRVGPAPAAAPGPPGAHGWRVEVALDAGPLVAVARAAADAGIGTPLRPGFAVHVAAVERRQTLARSALGWLRARLSTPALPPPIGGGALTPDVPPP